MKILVEGTDEQEEKGLARQNYSSVFVRLVFPTTQREDRGRDHILPDAAFPRELERAFSRHPVSLNQRWLIRGEGPFPNQRYPVR